MEKYSINPATNDTFGVGTNTSLLGTAANTISPEPQKQNRIPEGASLLSDGAFKYVYARDDERSRANLRQLVSILIGKNVVSANVLPTEVFASTMPNTEKASRFDIRVRLDNNEEVDIEVQLYNERDDYKNRLTYYGAKLYASQNTAGHRYTSLKTCYQVMISNVEIFSNTDWLLNFDISAQENRMVKFDGIRWIVIQLNYLEKALREGVGQHNEYLQNLLDFCTFLKNPQKTEPFSEVYEDCMSYWTDDEIEAYKKEMIERQRMDRESSKAYTEDLIRNLSATIEARDATIADKDAMLEANKATIEAKDATIADKDSLIASLMRKIASLEAMPGTAKA